MKKLMKNIAVWLIKRTYKGKYKIQIQHDLKDLVKESYQSNIREEFEIKREIVQVKKGDKKYSIAYFKTSKGKTQIVLDRNNVDDKKYAALI